MERKSEFGGKGNGLVWLAQNTDLGYDVPQFEIIDTSFYEQFKGQSQTPQRLEEKCRELSQKFSGRAVSVRSSGVVSEDNDRFSGAGIYETFFLESMQLTPQSLHDSVLKVYSSVDSERAVQYRKEAGLGNEKMAVVVQEIADGENGVFMSRLPARAGIIPASWSRTIGAVVQGDTESEVHRAFFALTKDGYKLMFLDESSPYTEATNLGNRLVPLTQRLKERYGKEFEAEFSYNPKNEKLSMLQIRPLTNVQDKEVKFPDKEPIFTAELCMGVGEYIGLMVTPGGNTNPVRKFWDEPNHYAFVTPRLEKTIQRGFGGLGSLLGKGDDFALDYDLLTPGKKAIVLTHQALPGMHAMTVANEKGILCLARECNKLGDDELIHRYGVDRGYIMEMLGGSTLLDSPKFDIPLEEVGKYIHVVSDGLRGHVYRATEEEAREFEKRMLGDERFVVSEISSPYGGELADKFWDWEFKIKPQTALVSYQTVCQDFVEHMRRVSGKRFRLNVSPANNSYELTHPSSEFEVFYAHFDPEKRDEGIFFATGRGVSDISDKETTRQWFQQFVDRVKNPDYKPQVEEY
ncbi:hypothetical protein J4218_03205 [Candidatus Pacearchaeota archaeon]|nr:hypothetical protein [Candidatus Pacearchaeota archaeon]